MKPRLKPRKATYILHRWVGLIVCLQLLAWSLGGLIFAIIDIDTIHGDDDSHLTPPALIEIDLVAITPAQATERATAAGADTSAIVRTILRTGFDASPEYILYAQHKADNGDLFDTPLARINATTGEASLQITEAQAIERARADFIHDSPILSVQRFTDSGPSESRGRRTPLYRVVFDHPHGTRLYINGVTGDVVARRNDSWRLFDWFWMLHIMDYDEREDFNNPLLIIFAAMAVLTSASGIGLWGWRTVPRVRKRLARTKKPEVS